jgi:hypothetical protein
MSVRSYKNKQMTPETEKVKTKAAALQSYHFPGEGVRRPVIIEAASREEAEKKYHSLTHNK